MRILVRPGSRVGGETVVPGDKSIAHRWLILAATADGPSELVHLPPALDVRSTARCLAAISGEARSGLERWAFEPSRRGDGHGFTINKGEPRSASTTLSVPGGGRARLQASDRPLDCGNSGTTMRLLMGILASTPFETELTGDESLRPRPMERVAGPLREMGASVRTSDGHAPIRIAGGSLHGILHRPEVPSAQVKSAVLLAGLASDGETIVDEPVRTRDHTERALEHLGAPIRMDGSRIAVRSFQHDGFRADVPGDVSSAAFLLAAAALTGAELTVSGVGLNPTRTRYLTVMDRMGVEVEQRVTDEALGEPVGELHVRRCDGILGVTVDAEELPLVIDEVPVLAALAVHAEEESSFRAAGELRVKESDRLGGLAGAIVALGGRAAVEGDDLVIAGGGLEGGAAASLGDHRLAMALAVAVLAARARSSVDGVEAAEVSFPGFVGTLAALGAGVEVEG